MALATLLAITIACIGWSLWIRRVTWTCRWEVAATLNIALQGVAVLLMSPLASETVGHWLHALTGKWNLEDYLGHDCYIVAASAIVYNTLGRLADDDAMQKSFKQYVERPATLCIPLLLVTFSVGNGARDLCARLLHCSDRLLAEPLLAAALRHPDLSAGLRHPGDPGAAERPAVPTHRQLLSGVVGLRHPGVRRPHHHRLLPAPADGRWAAPWCGCSPACAALGSRSRPPIRGGSRRSGSPRSDPAARVIVASPSKWGVPR